MPVMTPARARTEADYRNLTTAAQNAFDRWMRKADTAGTGDTYDDAMVGAALAAGIPVPTSRDIARCSCHTDAGGCGCALIFDSNLPGAIVTATNAPNRNLSALQCPTCGHDHPRPIAD